LSDPVSVADRVLNELGISSPSDLLPLELLAWQRGILVREGPLSGAEARLVVVEKGGVITLNKSFQDPHRKRFAIAHELGHFEMRHNSLGLNSCSEDVISDWKGSTIENDTEKDANLFASAFLMPGRFLSPFCIERGPSFDAIKEMADTFTVSLTASSLRFVDYCTDAVVVVFSQEGQIRWYKGSSLFNEIRQDYRLFMELRSVLDKSTMAAHLFTGGETEGKKKTEMRAWFPGGKFRYDATLREESLFMPRHKATLSLLLLDDDLHEPLDDYEDENGEDGEEYVPSWRRK
jgi:Zn-dependent peptidase ImmA (M78 family)